MFARTMKGCVQRHAFVALINLNAENQYTVRIRARRTGAWSDW